MTERLTFSQSLPFRSAASGGLQIVKPETAFSAVSEIIADGVFTSKFRNYEIIVEMTLSASNYSLAYQLRVGGVSATTNYNYQALDAASTTVSSARTTGASNAYIGSIGSQGRNICTMTISSPQLAVETVYLSRAFYNSTVGIIHNSHVGNHTTATAYDGIRMFIPSDTMTGTYTIFGYGK